MHAGPFVTAAAGCPGSSLCSANLTPSPACSPCTACASRLQDLDPASFLPCAHPRPWWERALGLAPRRQQLVGLMAQGLQRRLDGGGQVKQLRQPSQQLEQALGPSTLVFLSGGLPPALLGSLHALCRVGVQGFRVVDSQTRGHCVERASWPRATS